MSLSTILDTALGLALVYLLFSLIVSALNELILGHLVHLRARVLANGLRSLLSNAGDTKSPAGEVLEVAGSIFGSLWCMIFGRKNPGTITNAKNFAEEVFSHPLVQGLATNGLPTPGYLPPTTFADAVLNSLFPTGLPATGQDFGAAIAANKDAFAEKVLRSILMGVTSPEEARAKVERWFNDSMARVSGAYKRHTQVWLYLWAGLLTFALNIDTIDLARRLVTDSQFRGLMAETAVQWAGRSNLVSNPGPGVTNVVTHQPNLLELGSEISRLNFPIGWGNCVSSDSAIGWVITHLPRVTGTPTATNGVPELLTKGILGGTGSCPQTSQEWLVKLLGLLITLAAISQGAPFWFDVLNKVTNLRAAGKPPVTSPTKEKS